MKSTKTIITSLSLGIIALLVLGALDLWNMAEMNRETSSFIAEVRSVAEEKILLQGAKAARKESVAEVGVLEDAAMNGKKIVSAIDLIEGAARKFGLEPEITSVEKKEAEGEMPAKVSFTVEARGPWVGSTKFLEALENLPYRVIIDNVYFSKDGGAWRVSAAVSLYLFD